MSLCSSEPVLAGILLLIVLITIVLMVWDLSSRHDPETLYEWYIKTPNAKGERDRAMMFCGINPVPKTEAHLIKELVNLPDHKRYQLRNALKKIN